ncbi:MAG: DUF6062 family protein [Lachnospiraceae bacterium]
MKEELHTIPVNDAFNADAECPVCYMYRTLEQKAIDFTMGSSYMEDYIRAETDKLGFCSHHMKMMEQNGNKLGLALMLHTHIKKTNRDTAKLMKAPVKKQSGVFRKKEDDADPLLTYLDGVNSTCFVCDHIQMTFKWYLFTLVEMWKKDEGFREKYRNCRGLCNEHLPMVLREGQKRLSAAEYAEFRQETCELYRRNMERIEDELSWFIDKYDYRNVNEPWKNSRDVLARAVVKTNGLLRVDPDSGEVLGVEKKKTDQ